MQLCYRVFTDGEGTWIHAGFFFIAVTVEPCLVFGEPLVTIEP